MDVPANVLAELRSVAQRSNEEVCGLLLSSGELHYIKNVSKTPAVAFLFDKREYLNVLKNIHKTQQSIVCVFHTHPSGNHNPSELDLQAVKRFKRNSLIVSSKGYSWLPYSEVA